MKISGFHWTHLYSGWHDEKGKEGERPQRIEMNWKKALRLNSTCCLSTQITKCYLLSKYFDSDNKTKILSFFKHAFDFLCR